ncbi:MAG: hypothetical protein ACFB21_01990 [Opitutales bacterium]
MSQTPLSEEDQILLAETLANGRKIEAIRLYREKTGCDLREAVRAVDDLAAEPSDGSGRKGCSAMLILLITGTIAAFAFLRPIAFS